MRSPVIMWLRQDLRLADHPALSAAAAAGPVLFLYVLDDETPGPWKMGGASRWWLHKSLEALAARVPLVLRRGPADRVLAEVLAETAASDLFFTRDYAPWSAGLETRIKQICDAREVGCHRYGGFLLHEPESVRTGQGEPFKVYTPFSRACFAKGEPRPTRPVPAFTPWDGRTRSDRLEDWSLLPQKPDWAAGFRERWQPGEEGAARKLEVFIDRALPHYADKRDEPAAEAISQLSPHLHYGEISPFQCWHAVRSAAAEQHGRIDRAAEKFLKELLWREFSYHLLHHWPSLPEEPFRPAFADFPWLSNDAALAAWQQGKTGYPLVDAGMRELWHTGFMHNRVRMVTASFLVKHLLIPWQEGERWFWDTLVDADIANNAASWQWVAGCGADAAPYFRIFNPVLQGEKFDPDATYVRRWVPELTLLPNDVIHRPWTAPRDVLERAGVDLGRNYPRPLVDHDMARQRALAALKTIKSEGGS